MDINQYIDQQGFCEVHNKERFIARLTNYSSDGKEHHFQFKSPLPVRELNLDGWNVSIGHTVFGPDFDFRTPEVKMDGSVLEFVESERELTVKIDFDEKAVGEKVMAYLNTLTGV